MRSIHSAVLALIVVAAAGCGPDEAVVAEAASPAPTPQHCPTVQVTCVAEAQAGAPILFTAELSGADAAVEPTFNWMVSASAISGGQGTESIMVETTGIGGQTVTATVDVGGYASDCQVSASCSSVVK